MPYTADGTMKESADLIGPYIDRIDTYLTTGIAADYLPLAGGALTGRVQHGTGDTLGAYGYTPAAQTIDIRLGTAAAPNSVLGPAFKVSRTLSVAQSAINAAGGGDGAPWLAAIEGVAVGTAANEVQPIGVLGFGRNSGPPTSGIDARPDAVGVYAVGQVSGACEGVGIGVFAAGRTDNNTGRYTAAELAVLNYGTLPGAYTSAGYSRGLGIWLAAGGNVDSSTAILIGNPFGRQFDVGIGFPAQVNGAQVGAVKSATIRDDGNAVVSILINGSHTHGLDLSGGTFSVAQIRLKNNSPIVTRNAANNANLSMLYASTGDALVVGEGATSIFFASVLGVADGKSISLGTTLGMKIGTGTTQKLALWAATPIVQPAGIADADGTLADLTTKFNSLIGKLEAFGLLAVA